MGLNGTPAQYAEAMALCDAIMAERQQASVRIAPITLSIAAASLAVAHVKNGTYERAVQTSAERAEKARRHAEFMDRVSAQMVADHKFRKADPKGYVRSLRQC